MDFTIDTFSRGVEHLLGRTDGPLHARLLIMPTVVGVIAARAGLRDARRGHPAFLWTMLCKPRDRPRLIRTAWQDVGTVFLVALVLDSAYQVLYLGHWSLIQALIVGTACAILPYVLIRSPVGRLMRGYYRAPEPTNEARTPAADLAPPSDEADATRSGTPIALAWRRVAIAVAVCWLPLLMLSVLEGSAWGRESSLPFLLDVETHLRMLAAIPLLLLADVRVNRRLSLMVRDFVHNRLIPEGSLARFHSAVQSAARVRDSTIPDVVILALVYGIGVPFVWRAHFADIDAGWTVVAGNAGSHPSFAGLWLGLVSIPFLQFLVLRWALRFCIWSRLLWKVSRLHLNLEPTHPDGMAGLHFLSPGRAFAFVSLAAGTLVCGVLANRILYSGASLSDFKVEIVGAAAIQVLVILGPLTVFCPQMRAARRRCLIAFGQLGQAYAREFNAKWLLDPAAARKELLGDADFQALADMHNAFEVVRRVPWVPFTMGSVLFVASTTLLPMTPLLLTTFSVEELVDRLLKVLM
jgi:hypothetical protein